MFQSHLKGYRLKEILLFSVLACVVLLLLVFFIPNYKSSVLVSNADTSLGEIHRNLTGDSYDVPRNSGKVVVNFLKQVSNDWE